MKAFVTPLLGPQPTLFNEQFVVKGPKTGGLAWHQDSGYVGFDHVPYLSGLPWMIPHWTTALFICCHAI